MPMSADEIDEIETSTPLGSVICFVTRPVEQGDHDEQRLLEDDGKPTVNSESSTALPTTQTLPDPLLNDDESIVSPPEVVDSSVIAFPELIREAFKPFLAYMTLPFALGVVLRRFSTLGGGLATTYTTTTTTTTTTQEEICTSCVFASDFMDLRYDVLTMILMEASLIVLRLFLVSGRTILAKRRVQMARETDTVLDTTTTSPSASPLEEPDGDMNRESDNLLLTTTATPLEAEQATSKETREEPTASNIPFQLRTVVSDVAVATTTKPPVSNRPSIVSLDEPPTLHFPLITGKARSSAGPVIKILRRISRGWRRGGGKDSIITTGAADASLGGNEGATTSPSRFKKLPFSGGPVVRMMLGEFSRRHNENESAEERGKALQSGDAEAKGKVKSETNKRHVTIQPAAGKSDSSSAASPELVRGESKGRLAETQQPALNATQDETGHVSSHSASELSIAPDDHQDQHTEDDTSLSAVQNDPELDAHQDVLSWSEVSSIGMGSFGDSKMRSRVLQLTDTWESRGDSRVGGEKQAIEDEEGVGTGPKRLLYLGPPVVNVAFHSICTGLGMAVAWYSFQNAPFWPWYAGGKGSTSRIWEGNNNDADELMMWKLKLYLLWQGSYHWHSRLFAFLRATAASMLDSREPIKIALQNRFLSAAQLLGYFLAIFLMVTSALLFTSLRRLSAIALLTLDMSRLCLLLRELCLVLPNNNNPWRAAGLSDLLGSVLVRPVFFYTRFVIWTGLSYSIVMEASDWYDQIDSLLFPLHSRVIFYTATFLLIGFSVREWCQQVVVEDCKVLSEEDLANDSCEHSVTSILLNHCIDIHSRFLGTKSSTTRVPA